MKKLILIVFALFIVSNVGAQSDVEKTKATVSKSDIEGHIYFLASDELKGRQTGSPEIDIAAAYIANSFRRYNVKPANKGSYYQKFELEEVSAATTLNIKLKEGSSKNLLSLSGHNITFNGKAVYLGYGTEKDFKKVDVEGKLVIVKAGSEEAGSKDIEGAFYHGDTKRELAIKNGAVGLIELSAVNDELWNDLSHEFNGSRINIVDKMNEENEKEPIHLWLQDHDNKIAKQFEYNRPFDTELTIAGISKKTIQVKNVVGMVEGTDPKLKDEYIIYSAHYDHEGIGKPNAENDSIYNGARDNAVGTVTVLSAAKNIAKYPTKRSALFILFTAEEKGLLGSKWYVEHPVIPLKKMVYCFNSDNGGYNDITKATIVGLDRTTAGHHIKKAASVFGLEAISDPAPEQNLFDRSDNVSFAVKGIPAPTYSMGFTAFDEEIFKYYHQTRDNPDSLDYDYLFKFFSSYVLSSRLIANDPETPFWIKGDKYYEAGKKLYKE